MTQKSSVIRCYECGAENNASMLFCAQCNRLQAPREIDAFALFGLEPAFDIDEAMLEKNYLALQQQVHPDRFARASAKEKHFATAHSLAINAAYDRLKMPLPRTEYLLEKRGLIVNRDGRDSVKPCQTLLMESLEAREMLEKAKDTQALRAMHKEVKQHKEECLKQLKNYLDMEDFEQAAQSTIRLKYLLKLEQEVKEKKRRV